MSDTERLILARTQYESHVAAWNEHEDTTFEDVVDKVRSRVLEGSRPMEVVEVHIVRHVELRPVVSEVHITEAQS